jgi:hypothetical protein
MTKDVVRTPLRTELSFLRTTLPLPRRQLNCLTITPLLYISHTLCVDVIVGSIVYVWRVAVQISATPSRKHLQPLRNCETDGSGERNDNSHNAGYMVALKATRLSVTGFRG